MGDVIIGKGGVFANRDFKKGEVVLKYGLKLLSYLEFRELSEDEKKFVYSHKGKVYLYFSPERYVNHSDNPNTFQDMTNKCDVALRDIEDCVAYSTFCPQFSNGQLQKQRATSHAVIHIRKGEEITTDSLKDDVA